MGELPNWMGTDGDGHDPVHVPFCSWKGVDELVREQAVYGMQ